MSVHFSFRGEPNGRGGSSLRINAVFLPKHILRLVNAKPLNIIPIDRLNLSIEFTKVDLE